MKSISKEIFEKEISMCKFLYKEKKGCNWWKCENCWVPLLLHKLYNWEVIEDSQKIKEFKDTILK